MNDSPLNHIRKNKNGKEERKRDRNAKNKKSGESAIIDVEMEDCEYTVDYAITKFYQTSFYDGEQPKEDIEEIR